MRRRQRTTKTNQKHTKRSQKNKKRENAVIKKLKACFVQSRKKQAKQFHKKHGPNLSKESQCLRMEQQKELRRINKPL